MRRQSLVAVVLCGLLLAPSAAGGAGGAERVSWVHPLGRAAQEGAYELVKSLLTDEGRAVLDAGHNAVIVLDVPSVQEKVTALLAEIQGPLPSVRVEARFVDAVTGDEAVVSTSGQLLLPVPESARGPVHFEAGLRKSSASRAAVQDVLVVSGGTATISVGREIPYQGWFYAYGRRRGFITGEIQWREVASRLAVRPVVIDGGRRIRLHVTPEFEYRAGSTKKGSPAVAAFAGASTELVVVNGEEVRFAGAAEVFHDRFFTGYDRQRRTRRVDLLVRATVAGASPD